MSKLPRVDPRGLRLRRKYLVPLLNNPAGYWYLTTIAPRIDRTITPMTRAWISSLPATPLLLMTHTGAKSGIERKSPLMYYTRGEDVILMASNYGRTSHPAWFHNVQVNPDVTLQFHGRTGRYRARVATPEERDELWRTAKDFIANYANYEDRAGDREIQIVVCEFVE
ncbi:MAG: nitroreductase family deazaflavin-dependent oxidoreductase [Candidatus Nanopelagicales bacterium]